MGDAATLEWLRRVDATTQWTTSVCSGSLLLAAAGIDLALTLAGQVAGKRVAQKIQLVVEYDPSPPYDAGSPARAPVELVDELRAAELVVMP
ncbi:transcriptional regulator GlxA family with amidase domain [Streptacidiphilus sp. MAP12-20]|uniref:hypothetical protein n=1 Tax=Streptacidiphilus sp. MAP12-20 TaxID=3156299 RepID=UPI0035188C5E